MDTITLKLKPKYREEIELILQTDKESEYTDIPNGKEVVYNDNPYLFLLSGATSIPSKVYINDEAYDAEFCSGGADGIQFRLKGCDRPFLQSFGAIRIEVWLDGKQYDSKSVAVLVSDSEINNGVINMIEYIYENCEDYLYEEHKYSTILSGIKANETISLEAKIAFLEQTLEIYKKSYQYLKTNPYCKLEKTEAVDSFDKLQSISRKTIQYITNNIDELAVANYDTGIRYNNQYYQPNKVLVERNSYSYDVYENRIIVGFLKTIVSEINITIKSLLEKTYLKNKTSAQDGYIDSMYQIFSRSIKRINGYIESLKSLHNKYQQLYYFYTQLFNLSADAVRMIPVFTPVFRSINAYRQIYTVIHRWFSIGNYDLGKDELLLSFISTSKIYEYYCLIKMLSHITENTDYALTESKRISYCVNNNYYEDMKYNNTFIFFNSDSKLTLYFQPVVYGDSRAFNGLDLFRNTSSNAKKDNSNKGKTYTPDYIIRIEYNDMIDYIILDAKFSTPENIRLHQLQELVYKYLFSISTLHEKDRIKGLYILCGKKLGNDMEDNIHDLAQKIGYSVTPFADILVMNGVKTDDYSMTSMIFNNVISTDAPKSTAIENQI
ncbi:hypothetical protein Osc1_14780 [Hominimerdicola sp. 21CYCFAH17_S]